MTRIKICCIANCAEAELAIIHGIAAVGLVSAMPSGPGVIDDDEIAAIVPCVPPGVASFLLTSRRRAAAIIEQQRACRANTLQLCDRLIDDDAYLELRRALPGIAIVQVIHVVGETSIIEAEAISRFVDALLLDSGNPTLAIKELGGTGRTHDWSISRQIRQRVALPIYLAGGLDAGNVAAAIREVRPFGVDVCSGVRSDGRLDTTKLDAFCTAVRRS